MSSSNVPFSRGGADLAGEDLVRAAREIEPAGRRHIVVNFSRKVVQRLAARVCEGAEKLEEDARVCVRGEVAEREREDVAPQVQVREVRQAKPGTRRVHLVRGEGRGVST